jgi:hypothetical protein
MSRLVSSTRTVMSKRPSCKFLVEHFGIAMQPADAGAVGRVDRQIQRGACGASRSSIADSSASIPSPVAADTRKHGRSGGRRAAMLRRFSRSSGSKRSILFQTSRMRGRRRRDRCRAGAARRRRRAPALPRLHARCRGRGE